MDFSHCRMRAIVRLAGAFVLAVSPAALGDEPADQLQAVQGKWVRRQATADGRVTIVKEHQAQQTIVTAYDEQGKLVYSHTSDFTLEQAGKVRIFTFSNRAITAGPNAGQKFKTPASFVYRVDKQRFVEVHGVLEGDTAAPLMIVWERLQDESKEE